MDEDVVKALSLHKETLDKIIQQLGDAYYNQNFIFDKKKRHPIIITMIRPPRIPVSTLQRK